MEPNEANPQPSMASSNRCSSPTRHHKAAAATQRATHPGSDTSRNGKMPIPTPCPCKTTELVREPPCRARISATGCRKNQANATTNQKDHRCSPRAPLWRDDMTAACLSAGSALHASSNSAVAQQQVCTRSQQQQPLHGPASCAPAPRLALHTRGPAGCHAFMRSVDRPATACARRLTQRSQAPHCMPVVSRACA